MDETIKVTGLSKSYAGNKVISNIELSIGTGQVFGLLGANGAGKTTTIECILGTRKADAGSVSILGLDSRKDRKMCIRDSRQTGEQHGQSLSGGCSRPAGTIPGTLGRGQYPPGKTV